MNRYHDIDNLVIPDNIDVNLPYKYVNGVQLFNIYYYLKYDFINLIHILGARGIGKSYDIFELLYLNRKPGKEFLLLKTTTGDLQKITTEKGNPYNVYCADKGLLDRQGKPLICVEKDGEEYYFCERDPDGNIISKFGRAIALLSGSRGVDYSNVDIIFYDEFIPDPGVIVQKISEQYTAFNNLLESVIRNREMFGFDIPLVILASNSTSLANEMTRGLNLVKVYEKMYKNGDTLYIDRFRNLLAVYPYLEEYSTKKKKTWLYRLNHGTEFEKMSVDNEFSYDSFFAVNSKKLVEYRPLVRIDNITIFKHKSIRNRYYACNARADCEVYFLKDTIDVFYKKYYMRLRDSVYNGNMIFSDYETKKTILDIFGNIQKYRKKK